MSVPAPHFLLYSRAARDAETDRIGHWSFTLQSSDGAHSMRIEDAEPEAQGERLELLAVVRGLEALPQPANVTLVTSSRYVKRVLNSGLEEWRCNDWRWERHGEMVPVKNADLWQRVERAMRFHHISCRSRQDSVRCGKTNPLSRRTALPPGNTACRDSSRTRRFATGDDLPTRRVARRRKSWLRNVLVAWACGRRRLRQSWKRWQEALLSMAIDAEAFDGGYPKRTLAGDYD